MYTSAPMATAGVKDTLVDIFKGTRGLYDERVAGQAREEIYREQLEREARSQVPGGDFMAKNGLIVAAAGVGLVLVLVLTRK